MKSLSFSKAVRNSRSSVRIGDECPGGSSVFQIDVLSRDRTGAAEALSEESTPGSVGTPEARPLGGHRGGGESGDGQSDGANAQFHEWTLLPDSAPILHSLTHGIEHTIMGQFRWSDQDSRSLSGSSFSPDPAALGAAEDWTDWRGPARDGNSHETGLPSTWSADGENLAWQSSVRRSLGADRRRRSSLPAEPGGRGRGAPGAAAVLRRRHRASSCGSTASTSI